jgi:hypothetical protein
MGRYVGIGEETTYGTLVAADHFYEALSESLRLERDFETLETVRGFSPIDIVDLTEAVRGDVEMLANFDEIGLVYKHLFGSVDTTDSGSLKAHTFPASTGIPAADRVGLGLSFEVKRDESLWWKYSGCKIVGFSHEGAIGEASRMNMTVIGKAETTSATGTTASFPTFLPMLPKHITVAFSGSSLSARSFSLNVENEVDEPFVLGSGQFGPEPIRASVQRVTGQVEVYFTDFTEYLYFDGTTDVDVAITINDGTHAPTRSSTTWTSAA